jgi:hypothetical protein
VLTQADRQRRRRTLHLVLTLLWLALAVPSVLWWKDSIPWLVMVSVYANAAGHWAAYEAAVPPAEE